MWQTKPQIPFRLTLAVTALAFLVPTFSAGPQPSLTSSQCWAAKEPNLKDRLEKGLKARLPAEFQFIARVVELVEKKTLPLSLVDGMYHWARRKPKHHFQYFEHGLRIRAAKIGVNL